MIKGKNFRKAGLLIGTLTFSVMLALAVNHHFTLKKIIPKTVHTIKARLPEYDTVLFNRFNAALKSIAVDSVDKTFSGLLDITDGRDSAKNCHALPLFVCTGGNKRYFRIGSTETILQDGICIVVEHDQKRIVVTRQPLAQSNFLNKLQLLKKGLRDDQFMMLTNHKDNDREISFVNDHHISCKEFAVTYDTTSNKLTRLYVRLTDIEDPLNKKKDRIIDLHIQGISNNAEFDEYPGLHTIIKQEGNSALLSAKYQGYKLIIL